jgi:putative nucleotidyltransferase with HDIG domain
MRAIRISQLRPGLVLGRPLLDDRGHVLLNRGVRLSDSYIQALHSKGFEMVYIRDPETEVDVEPEEDLSVATRAKAMQDLRETFDSIEKEVDKLKNKSLEDLKDICSSDSVKTLIGSSGRMERIMQSVGAIINEVLDRANLAGLASIRTANAQLYDHSVNVTVVSLMIARLLGLPDRQLRQLAAGCLLHDIGEAFLDPEDHDEHRRLRHHTMLGYELLKNCTSADILAPHVAYEHHEHQDGSGQPRGTRSSNAIERDRNLPPPIPTLIGEITAVADCYDRFLNGDGKVGPYPPDEALAKVRGLAGPVLNKAVVSTFLRCVPVYPVGCEITVRSDKYLNYSGVVQEVHTGALDRPTIILTRDNRQRIIEPVTLDLTEEKDIEVQCRFFG